MPSWVFTDTSTLATYTLAVGPNNGFEHSYRKETMFDYQVNVGSAPVVMLKGVGRPTGSLSGTLLTDTQYNAMVAWYQKSVPVKITDHLSRHFTVLIKSLDLRRVRAVSHPWKHEWSMEVIITAVDNP